MRIQGSKYQQKTAKIIFCSLNPSPNSDYQKCPLPVQSNRKISEKREKKFLLISFDSKLSNSLKKCSMLISWIRISIKIKWILSTGIINTHSLRSELKYRFLHTCFHRIDTLIQLYNSTKIPRKKFMMTNSKSNIRKILISR